MRKSGGGDERENRKRGRRLKREGGLRETQTTKDRDDHHDYYFDHLPFLRLVFLLLPAFNSSLLMKETN
jgi:hypothetical protein